MRKSGLILLLALSASLIAFQAAGQDSQRSVKFSKELNKLKMYDYSVIFLLGEIEKNPTDVDRLRIQLADTYIQDNKASKGDELIAKITASSPFYANAQFILGQAAYNKGQYELSATLFEKYVDCCEKTPPVAEDDIQDLRLAGLYLDKAYIELKKPDKAQAINDRISRIVKSDEYDALYRKQVAALNVIENMKSELTEAQRKESEEKWAKMLTDAKKTAEEKNKQKKGPPVTAEDVVGVDKNVWQSVAHSTLKSFRELRWGGPEKITTAFSYPAAAKALYLLEKYDDAIKELDLDTMEIIPAFDEEFKGAEKAYAPGAFYYYIKGRILFAKAQKASDPKIEEKLYNDALLSHLRVLMRYEGYEDDDKAYGELLACKEILEKKFGRKITFPPTFKPPKIKGGSTATAEAERLFKEEKYKEAIPSLRESFLKNRSKVGCADNLYKLAMSYAKTQQDLEAASTALYLANCYPKVENYAPLTLYLVAQTIINSTKDEKDYFKKAEARDYSMILFEAFLQLDPSNQYAGEAAYVVGREYYDRARDLAKIANDMPQGEEKAKRAKEAIETYKISLNKLNRVLESYANREQYANSSYMMLAPAYQFTKQFPEAADAFLKYCEKEKAPEKLPDLVNAKLGAANAFFLGGQHFDKLAKDLREEALALSAAVEPVASEEKKAEKKDGGEIVAPVAGAPEKKDEAKPASAEANKTEEKKPEPAAAKPVEAEKGKHPKILEAEKAEARAKELYLLAIKQVNELMAALAENGVYAAAAKDPKAVQALETANLLLGWALDGAGDKKEACKSFENFITKYPKSKDVPPCMMRMGTIYTETNNDAEAEKILQRLIAQYPDSKEGKNATFFLGRSLYNIGKYDKSAKELTKIFEKKLEVSPQNLRWISNNLTDCGGQHLKEGAQVALLAANELLARIDKIDKGTLLTDWVGAERAASLQRDPKERETIISQIREKVLVDAGEAAFWSEDYKKALEYLDKVLANDKTPYYYDAKFKRADSYMKIKDYEKARKDLGELNIAAFGAKKQSISNKAQCLIGESYLAENNYSSAFGSFNLMALTTIGASSGGDLNDPSAVETEEQKKERELSKPWIEQGIYKAAFCAAKLAKNDDKAKLVEFYKKTYPQGRFIKEIGALPAPEASNKP